MIRSTVVIAVLVVSGAYFTGTLSPGSWSRTVGKPQGEVMNALANLDIADQPGAPGSNAQGFPDMIHMERDTNELRWRVMSGEKVAMTMFADFKPIEDGKETQVIAHVERGDAPDDFVAPAFRSKGVALGLFSMALEGKLNELTNSGTGDAQTCEQLWDHFQESNQAAGMNRSGGLAQTAGAIMRLQAFDAERRRLGCRDPDPQALSDRMGPSVETQTAPEPQPSHSAWHGGITTQTYTN